MLKRERVYRACCGEKLCSTTIGGSVSQACILFWIMQANLLCRAVVDMVDREEAAKGTVDKVADLEGVSKEATRLETRMDLGGA